MSRHAFNDSVLNRQLQSSLSYDDGRTLCLHIRGHPMQRLYAYLKKRSYDGTSSSDEIDYGMNLHNDSHPNKSISKSELLQPAIFICKRDDLSGLLRFQRRASHRK